MKKTKITIITIIISIITLIGLLGDYHLDDGYYFNGNHFYYLIIIYGLFVLYKNVIVNLISKDYKKNCIILSTIISIIYLITYITDTYILKNISLTNTYIVFLLVIKFIAIFALSFAIISNIYYYLDKNKVDSHKNVFGKRHLFILTGLFIILFIPYLIDSFPGNLSYDFAVQIRQALGFEPLQNHHPYIHTMMVGIFLKIGNGLFGSYTIGIFIYTILQYLISCFTYAYIIYYLAKKGVSINVCIAMFCLFIAIPIFGLYSVWLTKDILFAMAIVWITIGMLELITKGNNILKSKTYIVLMSILFLSCMLIRKNGVYVILLLAIFTIIFFRKNWKPLLIMFISPIILFAIIDGPIREMLKIPNGSSVEMLSIPAQQMARIYKYNKEKLPHSDMEIIKYYIDSENIDDLYDPLLSDPVKAKLNVHNIENNKMKFFKSFIKLSIKYPLQTIESFTCTTYKFYNFDNQVIRGMDNFKEGSIYVIDNMLPNQLNVKSNIVNLKIIRSINKYYSNKDIPIVATLTGSGIYIYFCIIGVGYLIYKKQYIKILGFMPITFVLFTQLAGPVVDQRYSFSIIISSILIILVTTLKNEKRLK